MTQAEYLTLDHKLEALARKFKGMAVDLQEVEDWLADRADYSLEPEKIEENDEARLCRIVMDVRRELKRMGRPV